MMLVRLTSFDGTQVWVNLANLQLVVGVENGSRLIMRDNIAHDIKESPMDFWAKVSGQGSIAQPEMKLVRP
jgi:hypothetical protein